MGDTSSFAHLLAARPDRLARAAEPDPHVPDGAPPLEPRRLGERERGRVLRGAAGGAALVIVGNVGIASPSGTSDGRMTAVSDDDRHLPGLRDLTLRVHAHGARIAAQINHQEDVAARRVRGPADARALRTASRPARPPGRDGHGAGAGADDRAVHP